MASNKDTAIYFGELNEKHRASRFPSLLNTKYCAIAIVVVCVLIVFGLWHRQSNQDSSFSNESSLYLLQTNYLQYTASSNEYKIAVVSDMDKKSRVQDKLKWIGYLKTGTLTRGTDGRYSVSWKETKTLSTEYNEAGRGMELSELVYFDNRLLTCDDRTGIVFEITEQHHAIPLYVLMNGNGRQEKGFKCEWMTVAGDRLYVGSMGKEFAKGNEIINMDSTWVKTIDREGRITHLQWTSNFQALREATGFQFPGYLLHEAVNWNPVKSEWTFLPRRSSKEMYDEVVDEEKGTNLVISANSDFTKISHTTIGTIDPLRGVSSFKFIPFRGSEVVVIKTIEFKDRIESYLTVYDLQTLEVLMPDSKIDDQKYEGVEII